MPEHVPSSPAELLAMQEQEPGLSAAAEQVLAACTELGLTSEDKRQVALRLIYDLMCMHAVMVDDLVAAPAPMNPEMREGLVNWSYDLMRLRQAEALLEAVMIPLEEGDDGAPC